VAARESQGRHGELVFNKYGISVGEDEKVLGKVAHHVNILPLSSTPAPQSQF
jgi:hypothetical protein